MIKRYTVNSETHIISRFPVSKYILNAYWVGNKKPIKQFEQLQGSSVIMIAGYRYGNGNGREYIENMGDKITIISNVENHTRAFESLNLWFWGGAITCWGIKSSGNRIKLSDNRYPSKQLGEKI